MTLSALEMVTPGVHIPAVAFVPVVETSGFPFGMISAIRVAAEYLTFHMVKAPESESDFESSAAHKMGGIMKIIPCVKQLQAMEHIL